MNRYCTVTMIDESDNGFTAALHHECLTRSTTYRIESAFTISLAKRANPIFEDDERTSLPTEGPGDFCSISVASMSESATENTDAATANTP